MISEKKGILPVGEGYPFFLPGHTIFSIRYVRAYGMTGNGDVVVWLETESDSVVRDFRHYVFNSPYLKIEKVTGFKIENH